MLENMLLFLILSGFFRGHQASPPRQKAYYYVDQKLSWANAQQYCREHYADLATLDDVVDLQHLQASRTGFDYDHDSMWIGLYDDPRKWKWSFWNQDYKASLATHWKTEDIYWQSHCVAVNFSTWIDRPCTEKYTAFCQNDQSLINHVNSEMTWYEALEYCRSYHSDLAIVKTNEQSLRLVKLHPQMAWIGLHRESWSHWSDGSEVTFLKWGPDEPSFPVRLTSERCVTMSGSSGHFFDDECGRLYNFACQGNLKQITFKMMISSEADMTDPDVKHQILEQLNVKLAKIRVTGRHISWVLKD